MNPAQDYSYLSACDVYPGGVTSATFCSDSGLMILAGSKGRGGDKKQLTVFRMVDEAPFFHIALDDDEIAKPQKASMFAGIMPSFFR